MMELVTNAFEYVRPFSWWWIALPVVLGVGLLILGNTKNADWAVGFGVAIVSMGTISVVILIAGGGSNYDEGLLRSDMSEQLQIQEVIKDGDWYTGKDAEGKFVKFALVEKAEEGNTYSVLVEK